MQMNFLKGAAAGFTATVPMTAAMKLMHLNLPKAQQYPLPPRLITERALEETGVQRLVSERNTKKLTWLSHFSYGAATGGLYGIVAPQVPGPEVLKGVTYGLGVWALSYLGLLPALDLLAPVHRHPQRRVALMIAAHVVWGAALGYCFQQEKEI